MPEHSISIISKLEKASVNQILLYLYINRNHSEITLNELIDSVDAASQTIQKTIDYLELNEFITVVDEAKADLLKDAKIGPWVAEYGEPVIVVSKSKFEKWFGVT